MEKVWDNSLSTLINSNPQALLDLVLPGAICNYHHKTKLSGTQRQPDAVLDVQRYGERFIVNPEIQSYQDTKMADRLLLYHVLLWSEYKCPVRSYVIVLLKRAKMAPSPLLWTQPGEPPGLKTERIRFSYETIEMWEKHPEDLLYLKHVELLPLLPLTQGGATREIVVVMFDRLAGEQYHEFALIGFTFAAIMFRTLKQDSDLEWLEKRFRHMHDILRESPVYEWILDEGREEGIQQGVQAMQQAAINMVIARFAELESLARVRISALRDLERLQHLIIDLSISHSPEEMKRVLLAINADA